MTGPSLFVQIAGDVAADVASDEPVTDAEVAFSIALASIRLYVTASGVDIATTLDLLTANLTKDTDQ